jgi:hypothetical protein
VILVADEMGDQIVVDDVSAVEHKLLVPVHIADRSPAANVREQQIDPGQRQEPIEKSRRVAA